jgi:hypothetical protein
MFVAMFHLTGEAVERGVAGLVGSLAIAEIFKVPAQSCSTTLREQEGNGEVWSRGLGRGEVGSMEFEGVRGGVRGREFTRAPLDASTTVVITSPGHRKLADASPGHRKLADAKSRSPQARRCQSRSPQARRCQSRSPQARSHRKHADSSPESTVSTTSPSSGEAQRVTAFPS